MGAKAAFEKSVKKLGGKFRAIFLEGSSPCPCQSKGDPYLYESYHRAHPDDPDCKGTGVISSEKREDFKAFSVPVDDTEKDLTTAGETKLEKLTLYWPGSPNLAIAKWIEKLSNDGTVLGLFKAQDFDQYELQGETVAQTCKLFEVLSPADQEGGAVP